MKTIKFRGQCLGSKKWVYGSIITSDDGAQIHVAHNELYAVDPETVGQFTGLFDKNGMEIYEGDIIRHHDFSNVYKPDFDGEVIFIKSGFRIKFKSEYDKSGFMYWNLCFDDFANRKIEVIGNLHDNPELLKNE